MKIIAFIQYYQEIKKILKHSGLRTVEYPKNLAVGAWAKFISP